MKKSAILFILILFFANSLISANSQFTASVDRNPVASGDRIQVTYTINGNGQNFRPPDFKGFSVVMGPSQSQSVSIVNGQMSQNISFTYILQAGNPGSYTIKPASINVDGKIVSSNSLNISVTKGAAPQQNQGKQQQGQQQGGEKSQQQQAEDIISKNLFLTLSVNKQSVYQGEQITAVYKLYVHPELQLVNFNLPKMPAFTGFWAQDMEEIKQLNFTSELLNGVRYKVAVLKKVVLIPQQSGKLTVDPIQAESVVRLAVQGKRRSNNPFDQFFDDPFFNNSFQDFHYTAKSKTATVNVLPLPSGQPADFTGGVGNLKMEAWLDRNQTKTNEPISLKVKISGNGNMKLIDRINITFPPDFEAYDPKIADNLSISSDGVTGNKIFEYIMIPRNPGEFKIEPVKFSYFDLSKKEYITLSSTDFLIKVEKGEGGESSGSFVSGVSKEDIKYLGKDIRYLKNSTSGLRKNGSGLFGSTPFFIFSLLPAGLFILLLYYRKKYLKLNENQALLRNKKATKIAKKRLSTAKEFLKRNDHDKFHDETARALWGYISDKLSIPVADLTKDTAKNALSDKYIDEEKIDKLLTTIDNCEFARFAPSENTHNMDELYNNAAEIITELEGLIK